MYKYDLGKYVFILLKIHIIIVLILLDKIHHTLNSSNHKIKL